MSEDQSRPSHLDRFAESDELSFTEASEGQGLHSREIHSDIWKLAEFPLIQEWINHGFPIHDTDISQVVEDLPPQVNTDSVVQTLIAGIKDQFFPGETFPEDFFSKTLGELCTDVEQDLKTNQGQVVRRLMDRSRTIVLDKALGNENLRSQLKEIFDEGESPINTWGQIYTKAFLLHATGILCELDFNRPGPTSGGRRRPRPPHN